MIRAVPTHRPVPLFGRIVHTLRIRYLRWVLQHMEDDIAFRNVQNASDEVHASAVRVELARMGAL